MRPKDIGLAVSAAFAFGKEIVDAALNYRATGNWRYGPHGVEPRDIAATVAGALAIWSASP